jgi:hypothetical protein
MRREPGIYESGDSNANQDSEKLPTSAIGQIGDKPFEITDVFEKPPGSRLNGDNAIKCASQKDCAKYRMHDQQQRSNEVHLANHRWWKLPGPGEGVIGYQ